MPFPSCEGGECGEAGEPGEGLERGAQGLPPACESGVSSWIPQRGTRGTSLGLSQGPGMGSEQDPSSDRLGVNPRLGSSSPRDLKGVCMEGGEWGQTGAARGGQKPVSARQGLSP